MLYCPTHERVYTALAQALRQRPGVVEGVCDQYVIQAKAALQYQFPHLYAHRASIGTGASQA